MAIGTIPVLLGTGDHASRPAATAVGIGGVYSCTDHNLIYQTDGASWTTWATLGTTGAAPDSADYLVGTANGSLSGEIVVGATPGGELGNTWASPTVDATHSGSAHADFIAKAIVDVKGDIIVATAADTVVRLAAGTNGDVLTANSAATEGVEWAAPVSGGGVDVEDEGTPLSTTATTLDFVGAGVTATGSGATKTITIPGGGGSTIVYPQLKPGSPTDDFSSALSGWTAHSSAGSFAIGNCFAQGRDGSHLVMQYNAGQNGQIYMSTTNIDQELIVGGLRVWGKASGAAGRPTVFGIAILDSAGDGVGICPNTDGSTYLSNITGWAWASYYAYGGVGSNTNPDDEWWMRLVRSTNTWTGFVSFGGKSWDIPLTTGSPSGSRTITADRIAIGTWGSNFESGRIECDFIDIV